MKKKLNITYIISELKIGGAEKLLESIVSKLDANRYNISLIVLGHREENELFYSMKKNNINMYFCNKRGKDIFNCSIKIMRKIHELQSDIVHVHTSILHLCVAGMIVNKVKGRFYTIHSMPEFDSPGMKKYLYSIFFNKCNVKAIAICKKIESESMKYFNTKNIETIENGIDIEQFKFSGNIDERNITNIVHIGRFVDVKNQKLLIEAVNKIKDKDFKVTFVGDGNTLTANKELVEKLDLSNKIQFLGKRNDITNIMSKNAIFVLCSNIEGAPISIIEAMANGMAIISTDVGGINNFIDNGINGIIIKKESIDDLAIAIEDLVGNKEKIKYLSDNAKEKSKLYDINLCVNKHSNLYLKKYT